MSNVIDLTKPFLLKLRVYPGEVILLNEILEIHKEMNQDLEPHQGNSDHIDILAALDETLDNVLSDAGDMIDNILFLSDTFAEECILVYNSLAQRLRKMVALEEVDETGAYRLPVYGYETEYLRFALEAEVDFAEETPELQQEIQVILDRVLSICNKCKEWNKKYCSSGDRLAAIKRTIGDLEIRDDALLTDVSEDIELAFVSCYYCFNSVPLNREKYSEPDQEILDIFDVYAELDLGILLDEPESRETNIARARVILIPPEEHHSIYEACDAYSADLEDACAALYDEKGFLLSPLNTLNSGKVWFIDDFIIKQGYEKVAGDFLEWIKRHLAKEGAVVVYPVYSFTDKSPSGFNEIWHDTYCETNIKMRQFYAFHGFLPLQDTEYMFLSLS
jgi:hypothetical protein